MEVHGEFLNEQSFLEGYDMTKYERPSVAVDMVALTIGEVQSEDYRRMASKHLKILLTQRLDHPYKGYWSLPGGFVGLEEDLEIALHNKFKSKTGIESAYLEQLYTWGEPKRDPRGRIISVSYLALFAQDDDRKFDTVENSKWFDISYELISKPAETAMGEELYELTFSNEIQSLKARVQISRMKNGRVYKQDFKVIDSQDFAFDHVKIIVYALERLKGKIDYSPIAFALMPEYFTLTELQQVYEIILGKELAKANFRRKVEHLVVESEQFKRDAGHRPSKLFKFRE